ADRVVAAKKARQGYFISGATGIGGGALSLFAFGMPQLLILVGLIVVGVLVYFGRDLQAIRKEAKSMMVLPIAQKFGLEFLEAPGNQPTVYEFREARLLPDWDRSDFEDKLTGRRGEVDFEFFEAHLEEKRTTRDSNGRTQTKWVTVFRGQCLRFDFHKPFLGETLVTRDAGIFNRFSGKRGMDRAKLEDPVFEKAFEVFTTDQVEARFLLTPDFMQRLVDIEQAFHGGKLRCAFIGGEMFVAVEGGDLFEPGSMFTPLDNPERIRELLDDFAVVFNLIDTVSRSRSRRDDA
ncbi:MAG: DUF3137 domain-containing protein, partial [Pseudomonadota bacterium]